MTDVGAAALGCGTKGTAFHNCGRGRGICPCVVKSAPAEPFLPHFSLWERSRWREMLGIWCVRSRSLGVPSSCSSQIQGSKFFLEKLWQCPDVQRAQGHSCPAKPGKTPWKIQAMSSGWGNHCQGWEGICALLSVSSSPTLN